MLLTFKEHIPDLSTNVAIPPKTEKLLLSLVGLKFPGFCTMLFKGAYQTAGFKLASSDRRTVCPPLHHHSPVGCLCKQEVLSQ